MKQLGAKRVKTYTMGTELFEQRAVDGSATRVQGIPCGYEVWFNSPGENLQPLCTALGVGTPMVDAMVRGTKLRAMLDSGATHSFVGLETARQLNLVVQPAPTSHADLADGGTVVLQGLVKMGIKLGALRCTVEAYVLPALSQGVDLLLGSVMLNAYSSVLDYGTKKVTFMKNHAAYPCRFTLGASVLVGQEDPAVHHVISAFMTQKVDGEPVPKYETLSRNHVLLRYPDFTKPFTFEVVSDASLLGMGAVLLQEGAPVAFTSKKFSPAEKNYTTGEQELVGVVHALREWRCYLEGPQEVTIVADHHPLIYLKTQPHLSRKQARWAEFLSRFHITWQHRSGKLNVADAISRNPALMAVTRGQQSVRDRIRAAYSQDPC